MAFSTNEDGIIKLWQQVEPVEAVSAESAEPVEPLIAMSVSVSISAVLDGVLVLVDGFSVQYSPA